MEDKEWNSARIKLMESLTELQDEYHGTHIQQKISKRVLNLVTSMLTSDISSDDEESASDGEKAQNFRLSQDEIGRLHELMDVHKERTVTN